MVRNWCELWISRCGRRWKHCFDCLLTQRRWKNTQWNTSAGNCETCGKHFGCCASSNSTEFFTSSKTLWIIISPFYSSLACWYSVFSFFRFSECSLCPLFPLYPLFTFSSPPSTSFSGSIFLSRIQDVPSILAENCSPPHSAMSI